MRVVLDVNVLVSGFVARSGTLGAILAAWTGGQFELVTSEHILAGCHRAWTKPYFHSRYTDNEIHATLALLQTDAMLVTPVSTVRDVTDDLEDDLVLATAVAGDAAYLVTGDNGLLAVEGFWNVSIVSPREFLVLLEGND
jgi:putative PIN family toxin of toxin-antitoxin system